MSGTPVYARASTALWRRVGEEVLLTAPGRAEIDRLSVAASAVWLHLERPSSRPELAEAMSAEFDADLAQVVGHVDRLIDALEARAWIVRTVGE